MKRPLLRDVRMAQNNESDEDGMESAPMGIFRQTLNTIGTNKQNAGCQKASGINGGPRSVSFWYAQKKRMLISPQVQWYGADRTPGDGEGATAFLGFF